MHKEKCIFLISGDAQGKAIVYKDILDKVANSSKLFANFIEKLQEIVDKEMKIARSIHASVDVSKIIDGALMNAVNILHRGPFLMQFKSFVFDSKMDIRKAFLKAFDANTSKVLNEPYRWTSKKEVLDIIEYVRKRTLSLINKVLIHKLIQNVKSDFIFVTDDFQSELFDGVSSFLQGIICKNKQKSGEPNAYAIDFGIPLVLCKEEITSKDYILIDQKSKKIIMNPSKQQRVEHALMIKNSLDINLETLDFKDNRIKIYGSAVNSLSVDSIAQSNNYYGLCSFRTEYYYAARGITPSLEEQTVKYVEIIKKMNGKDVFIEIPHFDNNIKLEIMGEECTDCDGLDKYGSVFETFLDAAASASLETQTKIHIVVPMMIRKEEVKEWIMHIQYHFDKKKALRPSIGGALESEVAIMYADDFRKLDFIIIGLDDFYDEIDDDFDKLKGNAHIEMINSVSLDDLRRLHNRLQRIKGVQKHIFHGNILTNPDIVHKFLKRGFKEFAIPANKMYLVHHVFAKHLASIGKYKGYRAEKRAKKLALELKKSLDKDKDKDPK
ncbi:MAG: putative PEP-binding protein [Acholeplasmataceae bacterium]|nr:putative PEP-binding protein [Acholeplasmataceae bacterium]